MDYPFNEEYEIDEKDLWEDGEVCKDCGERLPEEIKEEYTCSCGSTYTTDKRP